MYDNQYVTLEQQISVPSCLDCHTVSCEATHSHHGGQTSTHRRSPAPLRRTDLNTQALSCSSQEIACYQVLLLISERGARSMIQRIKYFTGCIKEKWNYTASKLRDQRTKKSKFHVSYKYLFKCCKWIQWKVVTEMFNILNIKSLFPISLLPESTNIYKLLITFIVQVHSTFQLRHLYSKHLFSNSEGPPTLWHEDERRV